MTAVALVLVLLLGCAPASPDRSDVLLADSEQQGQQQRPLNTPMPETPTQPTMSTGD